MKKVILALVLTGSLWSDSVRSQADLLDQDVRSECSYLVIKQGHENRVGLAYLLGLAYAIDAENSKNFTFEIYQACIYAMNSKNVKQKKISFIQALTKKYTKEIDTQQVNVTRRI
jgi:hypothetical protein